MHYDFLFITHLPAFYKVNLYNAIAKERKIFIIFIADQSNNRTSDFVSYQYNFDYTVINTGTFEQRNVIKSLIKLAMAVKSINFHQVVVGGWDLLEYWFVIFTHKKNKNCLILESTVVESNCAGIRGALKRIFLSRINIVYPSGGLHKALLDVLRYKGQVRITKGVGIVNKTKDNKMSTRFYDKKFLYLGRLSHEKNVSMLVHIFNELHNCHLTIVGDGPMKQQLLDTSRPNITFLDHIPNEEIHHLFGDFNFLILPSISEPWGLVVEEALYNGVPVIISANCGATELIVDGSNGYVFDPMDAVNLKRLISEIDNDSYQKFLENVKGFDIEQKDAHQISSYL